MNRLETHHRIDPRVQRVLDFIGASYGEEITLERLTDLARLSASYLEELFVRQVGHQCGVSV